MATLGNPNPSPNPNPNPNPSPSPNPDPDQFRWSPETGDALCTGMREGRCTDWAPMVRASRLTLTLTLSLAVTLTLTLTLTLSLRSAPRGPTGAEP